MPPKKNINNVSTSSTKATDSKRTKSNHTTVGNFTTQPIPVAQTIHMVSPLKQALQQQTQCSPTVTFSPPRKSTHGESTTLPIFSRTKATVTSRETSANQNTTTPIKKYKKSTSSCVITAANAEQDLTNAVTLPSMDIP